MRENERKGEKTREKERKREKRREKERKRCPGSIITSTYWDVEVAQLDYLCQGKLQN